MIDTKGLREIERNATPGPWSSRTTGTHWNNPELENIEINYGTDAECVADTVYKPSDAALIVSTRNALVPLLDELDAMRKATGRLALLALQTNSPEFIEAVSAFRVEYRDGVVTADLVTP